ncbi:MAG TPA: serine hydrolase domain-containing protein [Candidatus Sulfotelmatobacter sp.]|nr:serine hydrolase domain-containing protein [Candidatus Sulfotelmatobacter sp.]
MRNSRFFSLLLALGFAAQIAPAPAQTSSTAPTLDDAIAAIRAYAPQALKDQGAPGMSVAITDRTHTLAIITVGMADVASKTPVGPDTRFPIGSISKSMTTVALLQLHDKGLIDLNARVQQYLPSWSIHSKGAPILVHQLLSHTAGVPDDYTFQQYGFAIAALRNAHTLFPPGTAWSYSNDGFGTVGAIVAAVSRDSWQTNIENHVFAPLGMSDSFAVFNDRTLSAPTATGYQFRDADYVAAPPHPVLIPSPFTDFVDPAGSVISTPGDMAAYIRFYLNGGKAANGAQLLKPATFAAMTSADHFNDGAPDVAKHVELAEWPAFYHEYGYGLSVFHTGGDHLVGHTGGVSGYTACFQANLTRGFGAIGLSNLVEAPLHPCAIVKYAMAVLRAQSLGQPLPPPPSGPPIAPPKIAASDYVGTYRSASGTGVVVANDNGTLALHDGAKSYQLVAADRDIFWTDDPRFTIFYVAFERNKAKAVDGFTNGSAFYVNGKHAGPTTFAHPAAWDRLVGRYENSIFGSPVVIRVVIVKGKLTTDGLNPLRTNANGTYTLGDSTVRFDTLFEGKMQRLWLDGADLYRIELP